MIGAMRRSCSGNAAYPQCPPRPQIKDAKKVGSTKIEFCTSPGLRRGLKPRTNKKVPDVKRKVVNLLAEGLPSSKVCERLEITKQLEWYHRKEASDRGYIKRIGHHRPYIYGRGPNFDLFKEQHIGRVRSPHFVPPLARVHAPGGSAIRFDVFKVGDLHIFPKEPGKGGHYISKIDIPSDILGYDGGTVTLDFLFGDKASHLAVSPPEVRLGMIGLESIPPKAIFSPIVKHIEKMLGNGGGWKLSLESVPGTLHYAFDLNTVRRLAPDLVKVPYLTKGDSEETLILYLDRSHGSEELETTDPEIAKDILAMLGAKA